jgi:PAS domain S-box-containing protein
MFSNSTDSILFENNPSPMYIYDPDTLEIVDVNRAAIKKYGFQREEFKKLTLKDIRPTEEVSILLDAIANSTSHTGNTGIWKHCDRSGRQFFAEIHLESFKVEERDFKLVQAREISRVTEQQELMQAAQQETRYHLENTPIGIMEWDDQFNLKSISKQITEMSGYDIHDLADTNVLKLLEELVVDSDVDEIKNHINDILNGTVNRNAYNLRFYTKTGTVVSVRFYNSVLRDHDNRMISVLSIVEDLTDLYKTQVALQDKDEKFRLLAENSSDIISRHTPDGIYIYVSPSMEKLTGYTQEEVIGKGAYDFFHPDDIKRIEESHLDILSTNSASKLSYRLKTKSGSYIWVETFSKALRDPESGKVIEIQSTTRDITERKRLEESLISEKELLLTAIESMPGIFYMIDENQKYVMWNKNFEKTMGFDASEIPHMHPLDFYHEEDHAMITQKIEQAFIEGEAEVEVDLINRKGEAIPHFITGKVLEKEGRKYVVGSGIDISSQMAYEKELEESISEKQILLKEIHHRVKNNLAIVSALLELQKFQTELPEVDKVLSESQLRIKSMALIHEKLYQTERMSSVELDQIISDLAESAKKTMDIEDKVTIKVDVCPLKVNVNQAVPCALIINELLSNAFEHAFKGIHKGEINLIIKDYGEKIEIIVQDNGVGIPDKYLTDASESLGFIIINTLIEQLDANMYINNENGSEVRFSFKIEEAVGSASGIV